MSTNPFEYETQKLFPYLLGLTEFLDPSGIDCYNHGISWTKSYPRKLKGDDWVEQAGIRLYEYSNGSAYIEEDLTPISKPEFGVYGFNKVFPFIVVNNVKGVETTKTKFIYDPEGDQRFYKI